MNIFIEPIYKKKKFNIIEYIKYRKFLHSLKTTMPNFGMLWQIADFIKILERVYFYNNSPRNAHGMYSSLKYDNGENGFCVFTDDVNIKYKLNDACQSITIELERLQGNKVKSNMTFNPNETYDLSDLDEELLIQITDITMNSVIKLVKTYYKIKKV